MVPLWPDIYRSLRRTVPGILVVHSEWGPAVKKRQFWRPGSASPFVCPHQQLLRHLLYDEYYFLGSNWTVPSVSCFLLCVPRESHLTTLTLYRWAAAGEYCSLDLPNQTQCEERCRTYGTVEATTCCIHHELRRKTEQHGRNQTYLKDYSISLPYTLHI